MPNLFCHIVMFGWIPAVFVIFAVGRGAAQGVTITYLAAWLFLPMANYSIEGIPDYEKFTASNLGVLLAAFVLDRGTVLRFRPHFYDLPMLAWCLCPFISSITNGLGVYDGLSQIFLHTSLWGVPYVIGRVYFSNAAGMRTLCLGMIAGALIYAPLCIYEARMSPQLHLLIYGFQSRPHWEQLSFFQPFASQPLVFMNTAFEVTLFMGIACVVCFWLWLSGGGGGSGVFPWEHSSHFCLS